MSTNLSLTVEDLAILDEIKKNLRATSNTEAVRRALAQSFKLMKEADEDGNVTITTADGSTYKMPAREPN